MPLFWKRGLFQKNLFIPCTIGTLFNSGSDCDAYATICGTNGCCQTASLDNKGEQIYQKLILDFERCWEQFVQEKLILNFETLSWMLICSDLFRGERSAKGSHWRIHWGECPGHLLSIWSWQTISHWGASFFVQNINLIMKSDLISNCCWCYLHGSTLVHHPTNQPNRFVKMAMTPGLWSLLK